MMQKGEKEEKEEKEGEQINVYIRIRPMRNQFSKKSLKIAGKAILLPEKKHQPLYFDSIFEQTMSQQKVFESACLPIVRDVLDGNNACLFVYGQTGTGKTYTMGTLQAIKSEDQGLIPLSLNHILGHFNQSRSKEEWSVSISFMQIYMEDIYDLFNPSNGKLQIRESVQHGQTFVQDLVIVPIDNYKQSIELINAGLKYRKVGNQRMNQLSSRSHTIFTIYVTQKISSTQYLSSTLSLIDLAGSERVKKSNSVDLRLDEAKFINTSLSSLGNVISALAENNSDKFVPYRSSKLTRILKDSLTGRSKISVICTLEISEQNFSETYSTLLFADRCKQIRFPNQPMINIETFEESEHDKDLRMALEKSLSKEKEYLDIIKNLQSGSRVVSRDNKRETELAQYIQNIYKLFGEINCHLKKLLDPQNKNSIVAEDYPKVTPTTNGNTIKQTLTGYAQETIEHINSLSSIAFGDVKYQNQSSSTSKLQTETLTSILLDMLRQNIKLYENILIKDNKDSFEKEICLDQYEKEKKQEILNKLKAKKLKNLQNNFEEIWSESHNFSNPLTSLLNGIRKGQVGVYNERASTVKQESQKDFSNPKEFLKMLTRQQSQRKHKEMLIDDSNEEQKMKEDNESNKQSPQGSMKGSKISYFQKSSPKQKKEAKEAKEQSTAVVKGKERVDNSSNEIKKLLDSLIASKAQFEQRRKQL